MTVQHLFVLIVSAVLAILVAIHIWLRARARRMSERIEHLQPYRKKTAFETAQENLKKQDEEFSSDIASNLSRYFRDTIISEAQKEDFISHYASQFKKAYSLVKRLQAFGITPSKVLSKFITDYVSVNSLVKEHNDAVKNALLDKHKVFFSHCLQYPLDNQQRLSIISEESNCLVISSAGSGKTSSIIGKVKYLTDIKGITPQRILLISYTNKAAAELTERLATDGLRGYTFHKLAIDIIGQVTGAKPSICENTDALFVRIYHKLLEKKTFKNNVIEYFLDYQPKEEDWLQRRNEKRAELSGQKKNELKAMFPDMDGNAIFVRSEQEQKICDALSILGVKFRYEEPYEHQLADEMHSQYRPDFSIYYEKDGKTQRIYLEHFGIDEHGLVPLWFAKDRNITYEEANERYNDGITWKKAAHEKFGTKLLTTSSADFHYSDIKKELKSTLKNAGVPIQEKTEEQLYDLILPKESKREKAFIRLAVTFTTLIKSSCKSIEEVIRQSKEAKDERSLFIIKKIFRPIYEHYEQVLSDYGQIDFTDAILEATHLCNTSHPVSYDYIIVDEFQDISVDRYNFLKALREGNPPAKLYCVGDDWQSIYRFSGSDMALFNQFPKYFGSTEICKIETTYRFGEPLVSQSSSFIQRNEVQVKKNIHAFNLHQKTELQFYAYNRASYCNAIESIVRTIPLDNSVFLLGRYSFDDYYLSFAYQSVKEGNRFYYMIGERKIEFLTVHKSKGLEADYVILLQCNKDTYGFPSLVSDDPVLKYVLTESDQYPYGEERRLFYVAITRAKQKTYILYDQRFPSVFVDEFLHPEKIAQDCYAKHPNANKRWTKGEDKFLLQLHSEGKSVRQIASKMGRSQTSIVMRINKLIQ